MNSNCSFVQIKCGSRNRGQNILTLTFVKVVTRLHFGYPTQFSLVYLHKYNVNFIHIFLVGQCKMQEKQNKASFIIFNYVVFANNGLIGKLTITIILLNHSIYFVRRRLTRCSSQTIIGTYFFGYMQSCANVYAQCTNAHKFLPPKKKNIVQIVAKVLRLH